MNKQELIEIVKKYSEIGSDNPSSEMIKSLLIENRIISDIKRSKINLTYWNVTANSYLKIPEVGITEIDEQIKGLAKEETELVNKLKDSHLNILLKIVNDENELDTGKVR